MQKRTGAGIANFAPQHQAALERAIIAAGGDVIGEITGPGLINFYGTPIEGPCLSVVLPPEQVKRIAAAIHPVRVITREGVV